MNDDREARPREAFAIVALACSAGGLYALTHILSRLPASFPAPVVAVQHLDPRHRSLMAEILDRRTALNVREAQDGETALPGVVYLAPPDRHLLVDPQGMLSLTSGERVRFVRPAADLLFESVAAAYGDRAIAVVLTGTGRDGAAGVQAIHKAGGTVIAQNEATSEFFAMPQAAIETQAVDLVLPLDEIAHALIALVAKEHTNG